MTTTFIYSKRLDVSPVLDSFFFHCGIPVTLVRLAFTTQLIFLTVVYICRSFQRDTRHDVFLSVLGAHKTAGARTTGSPMTREERI